MPPNEERVGGWFCHRTGMGIIRSAGQVTPKQNWQKKTVTGTRSESTRKVRGKKKALQHDRNEGTAKKGEKGGGVGEKSSALQ